MLDGPSARRSQSDGSALPPTTSLMSVRVGPMASFVTVQVSCWSAVSVMVRTGAVVILPPQSHSVNR